MGGRERLTVAGRTVREVLKNLVEAWPEARASLWAEGERLAAGVAVFVGETHFRALGGLDAPVGGNAELYLVLPLLVGG